MNATIIIRMLSANRRRKDEESDKGLLIST
jgi:hypothetical protein